MGKVKDNEIGRHPAIFLSPEERAKKDKAEKAKKRKRILASYRDDLTQTEALNCLDELSDIEGFDEGLVEDGAPFLKVLEDAQDINQFQALLFSALVCVTMRNGVITVHDIGQLIGKSGMFIIQRIKELDDLVDRKLIYCVKRKGDTLGAYGVKKDVFDAVVNNQKYVPTSMKKKTLESFLFAFEKIAEDYNEENNYKMFKENVLTLISDNSHLAYVKKLDKTFGGKKIEFYEILSFIMLCAATLRGRNQLSIRGLAKLEQDYIQEDFEIEFSKERTFLQKHKLIQFGFDDGMADRTEVMLTDKTVKRFLPGVKLDRAHSIDQTSVIKHDKIVEKELFYEDDFKKNVQSLADLLSPEKFKDICQRLKDKKAKSGFTILMHGGPGTGKTESVMQLARMTGRDVLQVNISEVRSMWVGESEKNVQAIFDNYKSLLKSAERAPILLFNESDAIINKRSESADRAVEKMENSIASILLNNIENMDNGSILVATTNIVSKNLDSAFERRFLYKLKFPETTPVVRAKIWQSKLPEISEDDAKTLSEKYNFSGGEIDNVVRRYSVEEILYGTPDNLLDKLTEICENEKLDRGNGRKIGFVS